jgi:hypothetical protein
MAKYEEIRFTSSKLEDDFITVTPPMHQVEEKDFDFAVRLVNNGIDLLADNSYVTLDINFVNQSWPRDKEAYTREKISLGMESCDEKFKFRQQEKGFHCPKNKTYSLGGCFASTIYHYVEIKIKKCVG